MIRRFYIMPLKPGVSEAQLAELLRAYDLCDRFIPGVLASTAALDMASRTVIWENNFVDEETYTGLYMTHPYHCGTLDDYLMADSPLCLTHDIYTTRYTLDEPPPRMEQGIRRLVLMKLAEGTDGQAIEALSQQADGPSHSAFNPDNVGWVSFKGRAWTHILEQSFPDTAALNRYLGTRDGISTSSIEGLKRLGVAIEALKIFTYPFALGPQAPRAEVTSDTGPVLYTITARTAIADADAYVRLLEEFYDPYVSDAGGRLVHRWRTVAGGYPQVEVQSAWALESMATYSDVRLKTASDPRWSRFVREAMPLVTGGTRRFRTVA